MHRATWRYIQRYIDLRGGSLLRRDSGATNNIPSILAVVEIAKLPLERGSESSARLEFQSSCGEDFSGQASETEGNPTQPLCRLTTKSVRVVDGQQPAPVYRRVLRPYVIELEEHIPPPIDPNQEDRDKTLARMVRRIYYYVVSSKQASV